MELILTNCVVQNQNTSNSYLRWYEWRRKVLISAAVALLLRLIEDEKHHRESWVSDLMKLREKLGFYHAILPIVRLEDLRFRNYMRMSTTQFEELLNLIGPSITKLYLTRKPISAEERLSLTIRYLATGDYMMSFVYSYLIASSTIYQIIKETCAAIWKVLGPKVLYPCNSQQWRNIATSFERKWNFPHCCGAIDGKHVAVECPDGSGPEYYNYKGFHSIILLAVCDAKYIFRCVDIGACGRRGDAGVFRECPIGQALESGEMDLPHPAPLYNGGQLLPYVFVGDEAFPLSNYLMRPFPAKNLSDEKKIYNYRLSRARRTIENSFGIITNQWRILRKSIECDIQTACEIVKAIVCLHNWMKMDDDNQQYVYPSLVDREIDGEILPGEWRNAETTAFRNIHRYIENTNISLQATAVRNEFVRYFNDEGEVPWQNAHIAEQSDNFYSS